MYQNSDNTMTKLPSFHHSCATWLDWVSHLSKSTNQFHWTPVNPDITFSSPGAAQKHRVGETCNFCPDPTVPINSWWQSWCALCFHPQFGIATRNLKFGEKLRFNVVILLVVITSNLVILWFTSMLFWEGEIWWLHLFPPDSRRWSWKGNGKMGWCGAW